MPALGRSTSVLQINAAAGVAVLDGPDPFVVAVPPHPWDFRTCGGLDAVVAALRPLVGSAHDALVRDVADRLGDDGSTAHRSGEVGRLAPIAQSVLYGVTRRLSRESHVSAILIDNLARLVHAAVGAAPGRPAALVLDIPDLDRYDRPSIRVLYRILRLADDAPAWRIVTTCRFAATVTEPTDAVVPARTARTMDEELHRRLWDARAQFMARLAARPQVDHANAAPTGPPVLDEPAVDDWETVLRAIGEALSYQNFERVYLLVSAALRGPHGGDDRKRAELLRLTGVCEAQQDRGEAAEIAFGRALAIPGLDPAHRGHLHYLRGLLHTKRLYQLDIAEEHYRRGLVELAEVPADDPAAAIERAWLNNGLAFVATLRARAFDEDHGDEAEVQFNRAFSLATDAFRLVAKLPGEHANYLRFNLAANLTFLLEIQGRMDAAVDFWRKAFERFLQAGLSDFEVAYHLRLGGLLHRFGEPQQAIAALLRAREAAAATGDRFYTERLLSSLGYHQLAAGEHDGARRAYTEGVLIAHELRDERAYRNHSRGLYWALRAGGLDESAERWRQRAGLPAELVGADVVRCFDDPALGPERPSPKLPPYIASVDLESAPRLDLNRALVAERPLVLDGSAA